MASGEWSPGEVAELTRLRRAGVGLNEIAAALGWSRAAVATKWTSVGGKGRHRSKASLAGVWYGKGTRAHGERRVVASAPWSVMELSSGIGCAAALCASE